MEVARGVHRLTKGASNFYSSDHSGETRDWDRFARAVAALHRAPADLAAVLLTHAHSDHTRFVERARADLGAAVYAHGDDAAAARGAPPGKTERGIAVYLLRAELWRTFFRLRKAGGMRIVPVLEA